MFRNILVVFLSRNEEGREKKMLGGREQERKATGRRKGVWEQIRKRKGGREGREGTVKTERRHFDNFDLVGQYKGYLYKSLEEMLNVESVNTWGDFVM